MWAEFWPFAPYILKGLLWSFGLLFGGLGLGFIIGLPLASGQIFGSKKIGSLLSVYVWFFRGTPLIVLLFLFYFGVFPAMGLDLSPFEVSLLVLGFRSGAYQSQIFRGAIKSISEEQMMAARSVGMSTLSALSHIIWPQTVRISLPAWSNEYATIIKDTAICFSIGVLEVLTRARYTAFTIMLPLIPYAFAGILYIIAVYAGFFFIDYIYRKYRIPGLIMRGAA